MKRRLIHLLIIALAVVAGFHPAPVLAGPSLAQEGPDATSFTVREGHDFATRVLGDAWDMSQYTDISMDVNQLGSANTISNIQVKDGVFSARSTANDAMFYLLNPGYGPGVSTGKMGSEHPILSSPYACLNVAMKVDVDASGYSYFTVMWAKDRGVNWAPGSVWGQTYANKISPATWKLYSINFNTWAYINQAKWNSQPQWQALILDPILSKPGTNFSIDWARLTDCQQVNINLSSLPQGTYSLWVTPGGTSRQIQALESFSVGAGGSYTVDVQGLAAGDYTYYVKSSSSTVQQGSLKIVGAPVVSFVRPSPYSGQDYATSYGNAWDFADEADVSDSKCVTRSMANDLLYMDTLPPSQSPSCLRSGANEMDPIVYLNTPAPVDNRPYRYLSFRAITNGAYSLPAEGMIFRWVWAISGTKCYMVSKEVPLDVVWQTYTIDLYNAWNGTPAETTGCSPVQWKNETRGVKLFRFDPNENITGSTIHQELDWIRLTKVDSISRGGIFPIKVNLSKPEGELRSLKFYYTSDLNNPTQNLGQNVQAAAPGGGTFHVYLPGIFTRNPDPFAGRLNADVTAYWNTAGVSPGEYYICAVADDGYNQSTFCSDAPMDVTP